MRVLEWTLQTVLCSCACGLGCRSVPYNPRSLLSHRALFPSCSLSSRPRSPTLLRQDRLCEGSPSRKVLEHEEFLSRRIHHPRISDTMQVNDATEFDFVSVCLTKPLLFVYISRFFWGGSTGLAISVGRKVTGSTMAIQVKRPSSLSWERVV